MQKIISWLHKKASPQNWFLFLALLFGTIFALATPAFLGGDELFHFTRAYQVANGEFIAPKSSLGTGGYVPVSIYAAHDFIDHHHSHLGDIKAAIVNFPLQPDKTFYISFPSAAVNNPAMYIPQALAIRAGMTFRAPPVVMVYMARLANLIFYVLILYLAIRLMPFGKTAMMVVALLPMHIVSASSASADTYTVALTALFVAALLYYRARQTQLNGKEIALFMLLVAGMSLTKLPMPVFLLLSLLIPPRVLGGTRKKWGIIIGTSALLALILCGLWMVIIQATLTPYGPTGVDLAAQLHFMLQHPLNFLAATFTTYFTDFSNSLIYSYPLALTPPNTQFPFWLTVAYTVFLIFSLQSYAGKHAWRRWEKWILTGLMALFLIGLAALLYLSWTPVGKWLVEGIQPRYLTPLIFFAIIWCGTKQKGLNFLSAKWLYILPPAFLGYTIFVIIRGFYL